MSPSKKTCFSTQKYRKNTAGCQQTFAGDTSIKQFIRQDKAIRKNIFLCGAPTHQLIRILWRLRHIV